jgi:hypothetical protein
VLIYTEIKEEEFPKNYPYTPQLPWRYSIINYFGGFVVVVIVILVLLQ